MRLTLLPMLAAPGLFQRLQISYQLANLPRIQAPFRHGRVSCAYAFRKGFREILNRIYDMKSKTCADAIADQHSRAPSGCSHASAAGGWLVTSITGRRSDVAARCCTPSVRHEASHGRGLQQSPRHTTENPFAHAAVAISTANNEIGALFAGDVKDFISGFV